MNGTDDPMEEIDDGEEIGTTPRKRLPTIPLLESLPSKTCRRLLAKIRKHDKASDQLFRLVRDHASRGMLQPGELRCLTSEINRLYAPNREREQMPERPKDDASRGIRDRPDFKAGFFRKPPSWGQKTAFGRRENAFEKSARLRIEAPSERPAVAGRVASPHHSEAPGARIAVSRKR